MTEKIVKVTNKGMISIPIEIRKRYNISDGDYILVKDEINEGIKIIPLESEESLRKKGLKLKEFQELLKHSRKEDLELEK